MALRRVLYVVLGLWLVHWAAGELAAYAGRHWRKHGPPPIESPRAPGWMPGPLERGMRKRAGSGDEPATR